MDANGGEDEFRIDYLFIQLLAEEEGVGHEVVDDPGVALGVAVDSGKGGRVDDRFGAAGAGDLMADVSGNFGVGKAGEIVVDGDALAEGLVDGFAQGIVEVRLAAEDEGKAVHGIAAEVHEHLDVIEDGGGEILGLVHQRGGGADACPCRDGRSGSG